MQFKLILENLDIGKRGEELIDKQVALNLSRYVQIIDNLELRVATFDKGAEGTGLKVSISFGLAGHNKINVSSVGESFEEAIHLLLSKTVRYVDRHIKLKQLSRIQKTSATPFY